MASSSRAWRSPSAEPSAWSYAQDGNWYTHDPYQLQAWSHCVAPAARRSPPDVHVHDERFSEKRREMRWVRCDECHDWRQGNMAGVFVNKPEGMQKLLDVIDREWFWWNGKWDASWYCIRCLSDYFDCSEKAVLDYYGMTKRLEDSLKYRRR